MRPGIDFTAAQLVHRVSCQDGRFFPAAFWQGATRLSISIVMSAALILLSLIPGSAASVHGHANRPEPLSAAPDPVQIEQTIRQVARWQMEHTVHYPPGHWTMAPLYDGLIDASLVTDDPTYLAAVIRAGQRVDYSPGNSLGDADSHAVGHAWLRIYLMDPVRNPAILTRFDDHFEDILANRPTGLGWSWADALYMAPPTLVHLAAAADDSRYLDLAYSEFVATHAALYDPAARLFYRDARFIDRRTPNGAKVFWSRGNGWVYAGLAEILDEEPGVAEGRDFYLGLYREMSSAILAAQQPDGLWRPSLHDPEHVPMGEASGSGLFLFGLAWGVRQGILDAETYLPAIERGWNGLLTTIGDDGQVDFVQPIGEEPREFDPTSSEPYGAGAVLGAGAELLRLLGTASDPDEAALLAEAEALAGKAPYLSVLLHYVPLVAKP